MYQPFKEHIIAHCEAQGFPYHEHTGDPWFMNIGEEGKARVHVRMEGTMFVVETPGALLTCVANAWDIACVVIDYYLYEKENHQEEEEQKEDKKDC